jgi:hypothetical protein
MQPYFLPYLGYFQLLAAVDLFVVYDDVAFIPRGWIHRNRILLDGAPHRFTLPLAAASQNRLILEIERADDPRLAAKLLRTLEAAYRDAPHFAETMPWVESVLANPERRLVPFLEGALAAVAGVLGVDTPMRRASELAIDPEVRGSDRILALCRALGASRYLNAIGGRELYDAATFAAAGVELSFLEPKLSPYPQPAPEFVPGLSIVDVLMRNPAQRVKEMLGEWREV